MNKQLSQEEIETLLSRNDSPKDLTDTEKDTLGELVNISMGAAATALSTVSGKKTQITTPKIDLITWEELGKKYAESYVLVVIDYKIGLEGKSIFILHQRDAGVLVDLMMGGDGTNPPSELDEMHLSAVSEATNQMMGGATTALAEMLQKRVDIFSPVINVTNFRENNLFAPEEENCLVKVAFDLAIEDLVDSETIQLLSVPFAKQIVAELHKNSNIDKGELDSPNNYMPQKNPPTEHQGHSGGGLQQVEVTPAQFPSFTPENNSGVGSTANLDLIMDIGLQLSVELGRTRKRIKEILELTDGSIVELDKLAGEPVDILVNDKLLAKGEVVIIDECFGVRVTEIVSPEDRIRNLK